MPATLVRQAFGTAALHSISRGRDSSGIMCRDASPGEFIIVKGDIPVNRLLRSSAARQLLDKAVRRYQAGTTFQAMGHARLVTNGSQLRECNNQPVVKDRLICVHNGIVTNDADLWAAHPELKREYQIDTEVLASLTRHHLPSLGLAGAIKATLASIEGTASCALFCQDSDELALFSNNASLYYVLSENLLLFASEEYIVKQVLKKIKMESTIVHLKPGQILVFSIGTMTVLSSTQATARVAPWPVHVTNLKGDFDKEKVMDPADFSNHSREQHLYDLLENNASGIARLKRCTNCILPETFPFIEFDDSGKCNYCRHHKPLAQVSGFDELRKLVEPYRRTDGRPDCIVPFSGGRDSTLSLHIIKKELGLNPIAFTYDWGMVTDLARRNIARVCGKLGVENIIVSADIAWKRDNIRKNVRAWLQKPDLGMIPLFMAGDKYFFYYCNQVKKQTGVDLNIWGINRLENTNFKTGFAGLAPQFDKKTIYSLSLSRQLQLFGFVFRNLVQSPGYLNSSVLDSLGSFAVRYLSPKKDYFHLFDYYRWNEKDLEDLITREYNWERSPDTDSTWRIGDGTAAFYNYIYYTVAGFTENDTFRSNQIREGMISREEALEKVKTENIARYETLRWYLEIIGLDFREVISRINAMPKRYALL